MSLYVSGDGLPSVSTNNFSVTPAAATQLNIPYVNNVTAGSPFSITVNALDPYGNVDPTYSGDVTLALANNPGVSTLGGTLTVAAANGVATFSGLTLDKPGSGYTFTATSDSLTAATSASFDVTDQLVVTTQPPSSIPAGSTFTVVVAAKDGEGNVDISYSGTPTVNNAYWWNGSLGGTTTVTAVDGVATFNDLTLTYATSSTYLNAYADGLSSVSTNNCSVTPAAATQLSIPYVNNVTAGSSFGITVNALDPYGNVDSTYSGDVTLALANNPGVSTLGGTLTVAAANGVATFSGLTLDKPGSGYTFTATSDSLTAATSASFDVTDQLVVTTQPPSSIPADSTFTVVVAAEDGDGNVDTSYSGNATVNNVMVERYTWRHDNGDGGRRRGHFQRPDAHHATASTYSERVRRQAIVGLHQQFLRDPRGGDAAWHSLRRQRDRRVAVQHNGQCFRPLRQRRPDLQRRCDAGPGEQSRRLYAGGNADRGGGERCGYFLRPDA